jgi:hypothetical protein
MHLRNGQEDQAQLSQVFGRYAAQDVTEPGKVSEASNG